MKFKITSIALLLMGGLVFVSSCKEDEENVIEPLKTTINVDIDGVAWKTEQVVTIKNGSDYVITATKDLESLVLVLPEISADTFYVNSGDGTDATYYIDPSDPQKVYYASSGTIIITQVNTNDFYADFSLNTKNAINQKKIFTNGKMVKITIP